MPPPDALKPWIEAAPPEIQPFLNGGGWLLVVAIVAIVGLLIVFGLLGALFGRRRKRIAEIPDLTEDLGNYPPPPALWGDRRLTVYELPVRLRLVVAAPLGTESVLLREEDVGQLLDVVVPGLSVLLKTDKPRVRIWPTQLSQQGFVAAFRRHARRPDPENSVSRWVLVMGKALVGRRPVALGFALLADRDNTLNRVIVEQPHQWMEVLRLRGR